MTTRRRWTAEIPEESRRDDVRWLVVEEDPDSGGWFLFRCATAPDPRLSQWDDWRLTRAEILALADASGVRREDWTPALTDEPPRRE